MSTIKILAFDQATYTTGYSIFDGDHLLSYGILSVDKKEKNIIERIKKMTEKISNLIEKEKPDYIVLENVQFQRNQAGYKNLSRLQGCIMHYLFEKNYPFNFIEPSAWKSFLGIKSRKREEQKQETIETIKAQYNVSVSEDEADAIGIGKWAALNIKE